MLNRILKLLSVVLLIPAFALAQGGITGTVTDSQTGDPLPGSTIYLVELDRGASANVDGEFTFDDVPSGSYTMRVTFVGYSRYSTQVTVGETMVTQNVELRPDLFGLDEVVVTGVVRDTERSNVPFSVNTVLSRDLELVPSVTAESAIRGKVAGVTVRQGSGQPGTAPSVMLRGATTLTGSNEPLWIVDGVILGHDAVDIESLDIESVEVIKGAAASSLYGSRAQNGVIQIRTKRGGDLAEGTTRITLRNEVGIADIPGSVDINMSHAFEDFEGRVPHTTNPHHLVFDREYPVETYNHLDRFYDPQLSYTNYLSVSQRIGATNYMASFTNNHQSGVIEGLDGYSRQNVRLNLDSQLRDNLSLSATGYYAISERDEVQQGGPFFSILFTEPSIDLLAEDADGRLLVQPAPYIIENNPLYDIRYNDRTDGRNRVMGSFDARWQPIEWFELAADLSYDRSDRSATRIWPIWWDRIDQNVNEGGSIFLDNRFNEALNTSINATFYQDFGSLATRTQLRMLAEQQEFRYHQTQGRGFAVKNIPRLDLTEQSRVNYSNWVQEVRSEGYYFITNLNYDNRYITDFLIRRDGSSLFGPDERWHTYFRASGAYRLSEEDWFDSDVINDLRVYASYGTAGGRPSFTAQYETFAVGSGGIFSKGTLGNPALKPELSKEFETGIDIGFLDRFYFDLTYARTHSSNQILNLPLLGYLGFNNQWVNAGTVESNSWEASLRAFAIQQRDVSLSFNLLFDMTRSRITEFEPPAQRFGPDVQGGNVFYRRAGEDVGTFYGTRWVENKGNLPPNLQGYDNYFDVNDDGYVVPVGAGNTWRDGWGSTADEHLWGTEVVADDGTVLGMWGLPVAYQDEDGNDFVRIGRALPDFQLSFSSNFRYRGLTLYALFDSQVGGEIYNQTRQWPYRDQMHGDIDQRGKPEAEKKPNSYYQRLYNVNSSSSHFVEDGTYVKLRELAVRYSFDHAALQPVFGDAINRIQFSLIGRNLLTWTNYTGFDPEVGLEEASILRFDAFSYPNYRTISASLEIQF
jgi:TonB-linked SusC/RagA family outer membrane protein